MTMDPYSPRTQIIGGLALAAIVFAAYAVGQGVEDAIVPALLVGAFVTFVVLGRARSDSLDTMSGIGDERTQENYTRAVAVAGRWRMIWSTNSLTLGVISRFEA